jgi:hypothetical protein
MYHILNFYTIIFLKFVIHKMNFEIVKSGMVVLTERENTDVVDADVAVDYKVQPAAEIVVGERES